VSEEMAPTAVPSLAPVTVQVARPASAVEILQNEPDLTASDLAERAGVSLAYARSLIRRKQSKVIMAVPRQVGSDGSTSVLQGQIRELARRLEDTENRLARVGASPASVSHRSQVLSRGAMGGAVSVIAEELGIPQGEVEFILKVERLKKR
jgi:hypothetical protein